MTATVTEERSTPAEGAVDQPRASQRNPADVPDDEIETPTFNARLSTDEAGLGYAEIQITCQYRHVDELHAWIIAATNRLVNDIQERGT